MARLRLALTTTVLLLTMNAQATAQSVRSPADVFGFEIGADSQLVRWDGIVDYLASVARGSDRVRIDTAGPTTLGNPFVSVTISSPQNLAMLDTYRSHARRLATGRDLSTDAARDLARDGRVIVFITHNIHSTEIASSQTSLELVYQLATDRSAETQQILDNVITVLVPSANPDGQIMVTDWYREHMETEFDNPPLPRLYHHYAGHDNNRDFFMGNLVETRHMMRLLFHDWSPQVYLDQHQTGSNGVRMFVPPYPDPQNSNLPPLLWQELKFIGGAMVTDLQAAGKQGVLNSAMYRIYGQEGALSVRYHNIVGILTETASARVASPITITREQLEGSANPGRGLAEYGFSMSMVDPWWGGVWHLRDIVEYQLVAARSVLKQAARNREEFLYNQFLMARETLARADSAGPYAYIVSMDQRDPNTAADMVQRLLYQGIEVHRARSSFTASDSSFPAGSFVILGAQSLRAALMDVMDVRRIPLEHLYPDGPYLRMYDAAAYTVPMQMGVDVARLDSTFDASLEKVDRAMPPAPPAVSQARNAYVLNHEINRSVVAVNRLLQSGVRVTRADRALDFNGRRISEGAFVVAATDEVLPVLQKLSTELAVPVASDPPEIETAPSQNAMRAMRVGLYQPWTASMDEGWTRFVLEEFEFPYTALHNDVIRAGGLGEQFDVIVIPAQISLQRLLDGHSPERMPAEYAGGIGTEGVDNLKTFVAEGGTLVTFEAGDQVVLQHFDVPVKNALDGLGEPEFYLPPSLLRVDVDTRHPLGRGVRKTVAAKFAGGRAYEPAATWSADTRGVRVVASYPDSGSVLMSGLLVGEQFLANKAAVLEIAYGSGKIVMFGFRVQHRAQTHGTYKLLFNALYGEARPGEPISGGL